VPTPSARPSLPSARAGRDVLSPAAALVFAIVGTSAAAMTVLRLTQTLAIGAPASPPEPPSPVRKE
jgi:hypothetical protein